MRNYSSTKRYKDDAVKKKQTQKKIQIQKNTKPDSHFQIVALMKTNQSDLKLRGYATDDFSVQCFVEGLGLGCFLN